MDIYIGFDSAWADNPKARGAICAVGIQNGCEVEFYKPRLASFGEALGFIQEVRSDKGNTLIALDQSTVVPNLTGMRPVERVAASLISWLGGGVQPSNRGRSGIFCDASPIWRFLIALEAIEDPERARLAKEGLYLMEVFPALALASLNSGFFSRLGGPRYNPKNKKTFRSGHWIRVAETAMRKAREIGCEKLADWCFDAVKIAQPRKADQDKLDSVVCLLIALHWRLCPRGASLLLGDLSAGYMVLPASGEVREYLIAPARKCSVAMDGAVPEQLPQKGA